MDINNQAITTALRYMRVPPEGQTRELVRTVENAFEKLEGYITPRIVWGKFPLIHFDGGFKVAGADFYSRDLERLIARCEFCVLMAATLGAEVDRQISLAQKIDMLDGIALDACASVLIDLYCDDVMKNEMSEILSPDEFLTTRFSPGYGDLELRAVDDVITILNATRRIGLSMTHSFMMTPVKSITAFSGIAKRKNFREQNESDNTEFQS